MRGSFVGLRRQNVVDEKKTEQKDPPKTVAKATKAEAKAEHAAIASGKATKDTTPEEKRHTGERGGKGGESATHPGENTKPLSLIKAAICVLQSCERPMGCKEIVTKALDAKIWAPRNGGLTPANTLSAAIRREIKTKGDASRFVMAERGRFALVS